MNRFLYAEANPATLVDPDGHTTIAYDDVLGTVLTHDATHNWTTQQTVHQYTETESAVLAVAAANRHAQAVRAAAASQIAATDTRESRSLAASAARGYGAGESIYARANQVYENCLAAGPQFYGYCSEAFRSVMRSGSGGSANAADAALAGLEQILDEAGGKLSGRRGAMISAGGRVDPSVAELYPMVSDGQGALINGGTKLGESGDILGMFGKSVFFLGSALQMKDALDREFGEGDARGRSLLEQGVRGFFRGFADIGGSYGGAVIGGAAGAAAGGAATGGMGGEFVGGFGGAFFGSIGGSEVADRFFTSVFSD